LVTYRGSVFLTKQNVDKQLVTGCALDGCVLEGAEVNIIVVADESVVGVPTVGGVSTFGGVSTVSVFSKLLEVAKPNKKHI
jgi:hypothetical protein